MVGNSGSVLSLLTFDSIDGFICAALVLPRAAPARRSFEPPSVTASCGESLFCWSLRCFGGDSRGKSS